MTNDLTRDNSAGAWCTTSAARRPVAGTSARPRGGGSPRDNGDFWRVWSRRDHLAGLVAVRRC
jgi:hypothetical protein